MNVVAQRNTILATTLAVRMEVWDCPVCGVTYGIMEDYAHNRRANGGHYYCPNGDRLSWTETESQRLARELKRAKDVAASERARADGAEASLRATKGHVTRLRKRTAEGECPFCGQHLRDLARHVSRQHVDEAAAALAGSNDDPPPVP